MIRLQILSFVVGVFLMGAGLADFVGFHPHGVVKEHPPWFTLAIIGLGFVLLFPDRIAMVTKYAVQFLPWRKDAGGGGP